MIAHVRHEYNFEDSKKFYRFEGTQNGPAGDNFAEVVANLPSMEKILQAMAKPGTGIAVRDRTRDFANYPQCAVGSEIVTWMLAKLPALRDAGREAAVQLGRLMVKQGHLVHVARKHDFVDSDMLYYFPRGSRSTGAGTFTFGSGTVRFMPFICSNSNTLESLRARL